MRSYRKSYLRSFANGVLLAGLPVAAFFGADYLLAPPAPSSNAVIAAVPPADAPDRGAIVSRQVLSSVNAQGASSLPQPPRQGQLTGSGGKTPAPVVRQIATPDGTATGSGKGGLVAAIQQELVRVGCYAGEPDGAWNDRTRVAMQAFNSSVHVNLPTGNPDYILLTLLQGHSSKACTRPCEADSTRPGSCVDKSIEARAIAPPVSSTPRQATANGNAPGPWTSTVVLSAPGKVTTEMLAAGPVPAPKSPVVAAAPKAPAVAVPQLDGKSTGEPLQAGPQTATQTAPLDGRMAVGVLAPAPPREKVVTQAVVKPRAEPNREAAPRPQRVEATVTARSPRSTFSDLARSSP